MILWAAPIEYLVFFQGLSKIARQEQMDQTHEIRTLNSKLKNRIQMLKNIASGVAHDVNNPIAIAIGNMNILLRQDPDSKNHQRKQK